MPGTTTSGSPSNRFSSGSKQMPSTLIPSNNPNWRIPIPSSSPSINPYQHFGSVSSSYLSKQSQSQNHYDKPSMDIKKWYDSKNQSIDSNSIFKFTIPAKLKSDIKHDIGTHELFKTFFENEIINKKDELLDNNDGEIINSHHYDAITEEDKTYLDTLKDIYEDTYLSNKDMHSGVKNKKGQTYPDYKTDLFEKSYLIYKNFEEKTGIPKRIDRQNDTEFLGTLKQRIDGLNNCLNNNTEKYDTDKDKNDRKTYYKTQLDAETTTFDNLNNPEYTEIHRIKEQCKSIYWNQYTLTGRKIYHFDTQRKNRFTKWLH